MKQILFLIVMLFAVNAQAADLRGYSLEQLQTIQNWNRQTTPSLLPAVGAVTGAVVGVKVVTSSAAAAGGAASILALASGIIIGSTLGTFMGYGMESMYSDVEIDAVLIESKQKLKRGAASINASFLNR